MAFILRTIKLAISRDALCDKALSSGNTAFMECLILRWAHVKGKESLVALLVNQIYYLTDGYKIPAPAPERAKALWDSS
jgi:hypothetical protein